MISVSELQEFQKHIPLVGNINLKSPGAYQITRFGTSVFNNLQMAGAEAYISGLEIPDSTVQSFLDTILPVLYQHFPALLVPYEWVLKPSDRLAQGARELMEIQYDLPEELFKLMLGESKLLYPKYSMALWEKGALNLELAQRHMLDDLIQKVGIEDGDKILDLGCGWGFAANYILSKFPNAKVTGLNLSHQQCEYIRKKMKEPDSYLSSDRFSLYEADFNEVSFDNEFDKVISIGVFEHIGNLAKAFEKIASFLKEDATALIHLISVRLPHNIYSPFLNKYIFPNMRIWNYEAIPNCDRALKTIDKWYLNGINYAKTLHIWLENFDKNQETISNLNYGMEYNKFRRIWRLYLLWCIAYFESCDGEILGLGQYLLTHN